MPVEIAEPQHTITTLPGGVRVVTEELPSVRSAALGCLIGTGSALEPVPQAGISHLLEHMLFRGTDRYLSREIDEIFDEMGSELDAETGRETTSLATRVLGSHLEGAFDVIGQMIWHPLIAELEAEREVVLEEIAAYEDDPQELVFDLLGQAVFGSHPLGRPVIGSVQSVASITEEDLRAYHAERYLPGNMVIAAAGSVDHEQLVRMVSSVALPEPPPQQPPPISHPPGTPPGRTVRFLEKDTEQYHVCIGGEGLARSDERRFALHLMDAVLGASAASRLFQEVRERRGLAYSIFSFTSLHAQTGEIGIYVGTRAENLAQTIATIATELRRFVEDPAEERELRRARESVKGRMVLAMESPGARMARLASGVLHGLPILTVDETIERIDAVSMQDLRELAAELLDPARLSIAAIGPAAGRFEAAVGPLEAVAA